MTIKKDNLKFGFILGFFAPLLSITIYYIVKFYPHFSVRQFLNFLKSNPGQITALAVPCLVLNIALFTFYINSHLDRTAKGIFATTIVYAISTLVLKMVL
ncbi:MAG TPA: hypothetical protein VKR32_06975 [Puia sp.]|nr:hypothetical protein [Puia sp.]